MTAEEKRERILKRMLPAIGITVIYFVFISNIMVDQKDKAQEDYLKIAQRGISPATIPGIKRQSEQILQQTIDLQKKQAERQQQIKKMAVFIDKAGGSTQTTTLLATILADNGVRVTEDENRTVADTELSPSLKEIKQLLLPGKPIIAQHLELRASYVAMYSALKQMKELKLQAVPIIFNMASPEDTAEVKPGELLWELDLWI